jgi:hypothetical protein
MIDDVRIKRARTHSTAFKKEERNGFEFKSCCERQLTCGMSLRMHLTFIRTRDGVNTWQYNTKKRKHRKKIVVNMSHLWNVTEDALDANSHARRREHCAPQQVATPRHRFGVLGL